MTTGWWLCDGKQGGRGGAAGEEREKKEAGSRARLQKGELGLDIYDMRKSLAEKGLKYVDGPLE